MHFIVGGRDESNPVRLELVSSGGDTIDLNALMQHDEGVQALAGLTGLGLPPVDVQWAVGAGDGARYRNTRVLPRDIDLPLWLHANSREGLKQLVRRVSTALASECLLRMIEPDGTTWYARVHRVGGGAYTYGADTNGTKDLQLVVTLRAGDPYWTSENPVRGTMPSLSTAEVVTGTLVNPGTVPVHASWKVEGPGNGLIIRGAGTDLRWDGYLYENEYLEIDGRTGRITDQSGQSRYYQVSETPRFEPVPAGGSEFEVTWGMMDVIPERRNWATHPTNITVLPPGFTGDTNTNARPLNGKLRIGGLTGSTSSDATATSTMTFSGLDPSTMYYVGLDTEAIKTNKGTSVSLFEIYGTVDGVKTNVVVSEEQPVGMVRRSLATLKSDANGNLAITITFKKVPTQTWVPGSSYTEYEYRRAQTTTQWRYVKDTYYNFGKDSEYHAPTTEYGAWGSSEGSREQYNIAHQNHTDGVDKYWESRQVSSGSYEYTWSTGSPGAGWEATGNSRTVGSSGYYQTTYTWPEFALDHFLVSEDSSEYFDGSYPTNEATIYRWDGTAFASVSIATPNKSNDRNKAKVSYNLEPREWMVV